MRPWIAVLALAALAAVSFAVLSAPPETAAQSPAADPKAAASKASTPQAGAPQAKAARPKPITVRGEILDLSCYLARGLRGPLHRDCAKKCIQSGVPMGIMGPDSTVYLLTPDHGRAMTPASYTGPDPYVLCKDWASLTVEVGGLAFVRHGTHILEVARAKVVPAAAGTAAPGAAAP